MKYLFLIPEYLTGMSFLQQPICFLNSAAILEKKGIHVDILDNRAKHYSTSILLKKVEEYNVIVITTTPYDQVQNYFVDYRYSVTKQTINLIKSTYTDKLIIVCGAHGTARPNLIKKDIEFDILIRGEYDYAIPKIIERIELNKGLTSIKNLIIKENNKYIETEYDIEASREEFDNTILPAYHKINMNDYFGNAHYKNINIKKKHWCIIQASKGCSFTCAYCHKFFGSKVRFRSVESVISELKLLEKKYNIEEVFFIDSTFTINREFVKKLCNSIICNNINIKWSCETRIDCVDEELIDLMSKANCKAIWFGIESFDDEVLKINKKDICETEIINTLNLINKKEGIETKVFIMLGMMGETRKSINKTLQRMKENKLPSTKSTITCTPRYDTLYYEFAKKQYDFLEDSFYNLNLVNGQVNNQINEYDLYEAINSMKQIT